jgi:carboxymethylenebutenolidase
MLEGSIAIDENTAGYETRQDSATPVPGILLLHESTGLNNYTKDVTRELAKEGFIGLAIDLYQGKIAASYEEGLRLLREHVTRDGLKTNIEAAIGYLHSARHCSGKIGILGFGTGGGFALMAACSFPEDIQACGLFYPRIETLDDLEQLECPVMVNAGADDEKFVVPIVETLKPMLEKLNKQFEIKIYDGAPHGFHRHTTPRVYREEAAIDAFRRTVELFRKTLS